MFTLSAKLLQLNNVHKDKNAFFFFSQKPTSGVEWEEAATGSWEKTKKDYKTSNMYLNLKLTFRINIWNTKTTTVFTF